MKVLGIDTSQLSDLHQWELLPNLGSIPQRAYPSYSSNFNDEHTPGKIVRGYLYNANAPENQNQTSILEKTISEVNYFVKGYFVILASGRGCISVVGSGGDHLVKYLPDGETTIVEKIRMIEKTLEQQAEDQRLKEKREAEYAANQQRVKKLRNELEELENQLKQLEINSEGMDGAQKLRKRIWEIREILREIDRQPSDCLIS